MNLLPPCLKQSWNTEGETADNEKEQRSKNRVDALARRVLVVRCNPPQINRSWNPRDAREEQNQNPACSAHDVVIPSGAEPQPDEPAARNGSRAKPKSGAAVGSSDLLGVFIQILWL